MVKTAGCVLVSLVIAFVPLSFLSGEPPKKESLAIAHVTVIDVSAGGHFPDHTVVIEGERIVGIGKSSEFRIPAGARVVDGTGKFLIPGLWDMHVHVSHEDVFFPLLVAHGVTGIREMGNDPGLIRSWQKEIREERIMGPRIFAAGPMIDGPDIRIPNSRINASAEAEAREAVRRLRDLGADFVKVWSMLSREAYFGIADEAQKRNMTFAGHVPFFVTAREASEAGQKSIEHLANVLLGCSAEERRLMKERSDAVKSGTSGAAFRFLEMWFYRQSKDIVDTFDKRKAESLFKTFEEKNTWMCPTLRLWRSYAFMDDPETKNDPRLKFVPDEWNPKEMWFLKDQTAEDLVQVKRVFAKDLEIVGAMHRAGVRFIAGTDAPNIHLFPGFALHDELVLLVEAGFSSLEALQAATIHPALFMGTQDSMGTVEEGKFADLVLLDADPTTDIRNLGKIHAVVVNGRFLDRRSLDGLLDKAARPSGKS